MRTLLESFLAQAPQRPAVISGEGGQVWTFGQLLAATVHTAGRLRQGSGCAGRTVLVHARGAGGPLFSVADLAVLLAGAVPAVIPTHLPPGQTQQLLQMLNPAAVIDTAPGHAHPVLDAAHARRLPVHCLTEAGPWPGEPGAAGRRAARAWAVERREPAAAIVFTSGTTGSPRGVILRDQDLVAGIRAWRAHWPADATARGTLAYLPVEHVAQRIMGHYLMCLFGTTVHTTTPPQAAETLVRVRPSLLWGVPHTWAHLAQEAERDPGVAAALGEVRLAINGAAALDARVAGRLAACGLNVAGAYGATETTVPAFHQPDVRDGHLGSPVGVEHRLAEDGELLIRSPYAAAGYVTRWPAMRPVTRQGWWHTGDVAHDDGSGRLRLGGRVASAFKTARGRLVQPEPLEAYLLAQPGVAAACLVGDALPATVALVSAPHTADWPDEQIRALEADLASRLARAQRSGAVPWTDLGAVRVVADTWAELGLATSTGKPRRAQLARHYTQLITTAVREDLHA
ncbi:AMP-binding protein [Streptomyces rubradiris]|uniref:AMP-binding protein n=1 Tax=Streptomyces rubradiris TaxID=285531 RepID=UPI0036F0DFA4